MARFEFCERSLEALFAQQLFDSTLPKLENEFAEVKEARQKRPDTDWDDISTAFWATPELPNNPVKIAARLEIALEIILRNKAVPTRKRRKIISRYNELCQEDYALPI